MIRMVNNIFNSIRLLFSFSAVCQLVDNTYYSEVRVSYAQNVHLSLSTYRFFSCVCSFFKTHLVYTLSLPVLSQIGYTFGKISPRAYNRIRHHTYFFVFEKIIDKSL